MDIKKKGKVVVKSSRNASAPARRYVRAAEDDFDDFEDVDEFAAEDSLTDAIDDVADNVEDLQDTLDEFEEDDVEITMNNNIADHYIAECDRCNGVFISAVVDSDQSIDHVTGTCPLCGRDTDQYLKWIIRSVND